MIDLRSIHLSTERLLVAASQPSDAPALTTYYSKNREHLASWEPSRAPESFTEPYWRQRLAAFDTEHQTVAALHLVVRPREAPDGALLGTVNLTQIARGLFQACYLGFGLDADAVGRGLMFEALSATLRFAFEDLALHRVMANHLPENLRSARLLRQLGFVVEGYARDYLFINGVWRDHILTALTSPSPVTPRSSA